MKVFVDGKSVANAIQARGGTTAGAASTLSSLTSLGASVGTSRTTAASELDARHQGLARHAGVQAGSARRCPRPACFMALLYVGFTDIGSQLKQITANPQFSAAFAQISAATGVTAQQLISTLPGEARLLRAARPRRSRR